MRPESWLVWVCGGGWEGQVSFTGYLKTLKVDQLGLEVQGRQGALHHQDSSAQLPLASLLGRLLPLDHLSSFVGTPSAAQ